MYGLFNCEHCAAKVDEFTRIIREVGYLDDEALRRFADEKCSDACGCDWVDDLPPLWMDEPWSECKCCGQRAQLVAALEPIAT
jgi:hypothetical protein